MTDVTQNSPIGDSTFSLETGELRSAKAQVTLRPQTAKVLALLIENEGEVVSKQVLMERIWPDAFVTDDSVVQCVSEIRKALDGQQGVEPDVKVTQQGARTEEYEPSPTIIKRETLEEELEDKAMRERVKGDPTLRRATDILLGLKALNIGGTKQFQTSSP